MLISYAYASYSERNEIATILGTDEGARSDLSLTRLRWNNDARKRLPYSFTIMAARERATLPGFAMCIKYFLLIGGWKVLCSVRLTTMPFSTSNLSQKKVLMLGAGFVTKPTLEILHSAGIAVTVGPLP